MTKILADYRNLKSIAGIKNEKGNDMITSMVDETGTESHNRQEIANVFSDFYGRLYSDTHQHTGSNNCDDSSPQAAAVPPFTMTELRQGLKQLKNGKSPDTKGIVAEMLKHGSTALHDALLLLYNDICSFTRPAPDTWKHTVIKVLHKSGDARLPQNYRPISIIPLLYKLFSRLIYASLDASQTGPAIRPYR